jgi:serine phosphatase RsbU (regulator of sigma subunit)
MQTQPIRLVIIEDAEDDFIITRHLLNDSEREQFHIQWARTLDAGLDMLSSDVDAVLLDLSLPDSVGWDTFARVHKKAPHLPTILLTGFSDEDLGARLVQEGAQDFLVKGSMDSQLLCRAIRYAIERKQIETRLSEITNELRARREQTDAELGLAREMQLALLPRHYPRFPPSALPGESALAFCHHYRPCLELGGDFFDVISVSETVAAILVCDVMGHGVQPALITAVVRGLVEELRSIAHDPGLLMTELNRALTNLLRQPDQLIFVSAACVAVDVETGHVSCANAGHPPPMLVHGASGLVDHLACDVGDLSGPAMGIDGDYSYGTCVGSLAVGDRLVLYTDGLYEVVDAKGQELGENRLIAAVQHSGSLPLESMVEGVLAQVEKHAGTTDLGDDVCIVAVEVKRLG